MANKRFGRIEEVGLHVFSAKVSAAKGIAHSDYLRLALQAWVGVKVLLGITRAHTFRRRCLIERMGRRPHRAQLDICSHIVTHEDGRLALKFLIWRGFTVMARVEFALTIRNSSAQAETEKALLLERLTHKMLS